MTLELPYSEDEYTDTEVRVKTLGDLRKLIEGFPDEMGVEILFGGTLYTAEMEIRRQKSFEHNGRYYIFEGLVIHTAG